MIGILNLFKLFIMLVDFGRQVTCLAVILAQQILVFDGVKNDTTIKTLTINRVSFELQCRWRLEQQK